MALDCDRDRRHTAAEVLRRIDDDTTARPAARVRAILDAVDL